MEPSSIEPWLLDAVRQRARAFGDQLRTVDDGETALPGLDWTVADLGQHVAALPSYWQRHHEAGDHFDRPDDFAAYSDEARSHLTERRPAALAELVESEFEACLTVLAAADGDRWLYGVEVPPTGLCGLAVNELVLHGRDLAAVTGAAPPSFDRREANAAIDAIMVTTPAFVDETKAAAQPDGVYHLRFRGGRDYTWTKRRGTLTIEVGRPARADAHLNADPATFLLASLGRISQVRAGLSGRMVTYGLRPWRFLGLGTIAVDGI